MRKNGSKLPYQIAISYDYADRAEYKIKFTPAGYEDIICEVVMKDSTDAERCEMARQIMKSLNESAGYRT